MDKKSLQKYVNSANKHLKLKNIRLLTDEERDIVIEHLLGVASSYDAATSKASDLLALLCLETAAKVSEIHPDMPTPTESDILLGEARVSKGVC